MGNRRRYSIEALAPDDPAWKRYSFQRRVEVEALNVNEARDKASRKVLPRAAERDPGLEWTDIHPCIDPNVTTCKEIGPAKSE